MKVRHIAQVLVAVTFAVSAQAQTPHYTLWTTTYCYSWGDPLGWKFTQCETPATPQKVVERIVERAVPVEKVIIKEVVVPPPTTPLKLRG
jgi:hypothetical protein